MSLFAIGDLHLHFQTNRVPRGQLKDRSWKGHAKKLVSRELARLRTSLEAAKAGGYTKFVLFLHYPPTSILESEI